MLCAAPVGRGDRYAGYRLHGRQQAARLCMWGRWVHLGLFRTEHAAAIVSTFARQFKAAGGLDDCRTSLDVRQAVYEASAAVPRVRDCYDRPPDPSP